MKVISNAFWLSFGRIAADLLSFVLFAAISRTFGPSGTGEYSYAFAIATLMVPLFGAKFAPAATLLPWFAVMKAWEVAFYRLLYAVRRQLFYCSSLIVGTLLIVFLNFQLIPRHGILGAISAAIASIFVVDLICAYGLLRQLGAAFLTLVAARLALALAITAGAVAGAQKLASAGPWASAILACGLFPLLGVLLGLMPHPRHSLLLRQPQADSP
jgi:O-antigen/teichoic acid export membrane protein